MIYFLIPLFNESENIPELSKNLVDVLPSENKTYVVVNDFSTDDTVETVKKYFPGKNTFILENPENKGPGYSFNNGFEWILSNSKNENDFIVTIEGDNTSDLEILPAMFSLCKDWNYDLSLASVYAQGGGFSKTSFTRKLISFFANQLLRFVYDVK